MAVCIVASARLRAHRQMVHALAAIMKRAGAEVDIERAVPEWHGRGPTGAPEEAIMDVVVRWPGTNELHYVDVTIRAPWSKRYVAAQTLPGSAAEIAWKEKKCLGRLHDESAKWLRRMANDAATRSGRPRAGRASYRRWRLELDRALAYVEADVLMTSMGSCTSRFLARKATRAAGVTEAGERAGLLGLSVHVCADAGATGAA